MNQGATAPQDASEPTACVVYESMFDNTAAIARAVARGLELGGMSVTCDDVAHAPSPDAVDARLLVVGAPTHAFSLSRASTRDDAVRQGADPDRARFGLRDWLAMASVSPHAPRAAVFDTRVNKVRLVPKSAATRSHRVLRHLGFTLVGAPMGFVVEDIKGPLAKGEIERAVSWGHDLARVCLAIDRQRAVGQARRAQLST